jgi:hypothetical protein
MRSIRHRTGRVRVDWFQSAHRSVTLGDELVEGLARVVSPQNDIDVSQTCQLVGELGVQAAFAEASRSSLRARARACGCTAGGRCERGRSMRASAASA